MAITCFYAIQNPLIKKNDIIVVAIVSVVDMALLLPVVGGVAVGGVAVGVVGEVGEVPVGAVPLRGGYSVPGTSKTMAKA